jgi:3-hydroxy acid dehydrogenase/malonic semialdehyde reductase
MSKDKIAFVTGASTGFGAAIARRFAAEGAHVIASARRVDKLKALAEELGDRVLPLELDVQDRDAVHAAVGLEPAHRADLDEWERMIDTNCKGLVTCTRAILPGMVSRGVGHVINIGSVAGTYPYPGGNVYGATKAFVHQFSLNLRSDLHGTGVRVTCVEPGMVGGTEFSKVRFSGDDSKADAVYEGLQALTAEDIAESVHWATAQPSHVNINTIELMPVAQSFGPFQVHRT